MLHEDISWPVQWRTALNDFELGNQALENHLAFHGRDIVIREPALSNAIRRTA